MLIPFGELLAELLALQLLALVVDLTGVAALVAFFNSVSEQHSVYKDLNPAFQIPGDASTKFFQT
jgi:hypothetical protein